MNNQTNYIEDALKVLIGLPLSLTRRNVDLRIFHFGMIRQVEMGSIGEIALHISGEWLIEEEDGVFVSTSDLYSPLHNADEIELEQWDFDTFGNWQDELLKVIFPEHDSETGAYVRSHDPLVVEAVFVDEEGNVRITFNHSYALKLVRGTSDDEDWRLFEPGRGTSHFVVIGRGG